MSLCKKSKTNFIIILLIILTVFRIMLANKIPLYAQADAGYDDFMMMTYTKNLLNLKWLGNYNSLTLVKVSGYSIFLAITYLSGIPYTTMLILLYIISIIILLKGLNKFIENKYFMYILYLVLLFNPAMFHIENTLKIYRGGVIIISSLATIGSFIGLFGTVVNNNKLSSKIKWSLLAAISLIFFYFQKEDSIWILPFCICITIISFIYLLFQKGYKSKLNLLKHNIILILPVISLIIAVNIYKTINYFNYGVYTVTDRSGTNFKNLLSDLVKIDGEVKENVWVTKDTIYKALDNSQTFSEYRGYIDDMYNDSWAVVDGEINGDMIIWKLRIAFDRAGLYSNSKKAKYADDIYKNIHQELLSAFKENKLVKRKAFYLSSVSQGLTKSDVKYFIDLFPSAIKEYATYNQNEISFNKATGALEDISFMNNITNQNSPTILNNENLDVINKYSKKAIDIGNDIVDIYSKFGLATLILGILGYILLIINTIRNLLKKNYTSLPICIIMTGLLGTFMVLFVAVMWFCNWFGFTKYRYIYNYACGGVALMQIFELLGIYCIINTVKGIKIKNVRVRNEKRN